MPHLCAPVFPGQDDLPSQLVKNPDLDPAPVNLTGLRKAGLARACELTGVADPTPVVESCFEVWRRARHDVERHLFPGVLDTLKELKERGVRLVAITNGNAQTDDIPCLKDLFEFCVLAEQVRHLLRLGSARLCGLKRRAWRVVVPYLAALRSGCRLREEPVPFAARVLICKPEGQTRGCVGVLVFVLFFPLRALLKWLFACLSVGFLSLGLVRDNYVLSIECSDTLNTKVGERKPQPGPFRAAVKRAGYPSEFAVGGEWVHVGDDWASDCVGGKEAEEEKDVDGEEEEEEEGNTLDGLDIDDLDDDDDFPTLEDGTIAPDESPEGKAQRLRREQEKARRRAEKLGILLDSDFDMAAGTAAANSGDGKTVKSSTSSGAGDAAFSSPREEEEERNREQRRKEEEEEKKAREELKNRKLYAREMSAIAMGHPEVAQGPGKMMSMGSSSYVMDMLMNDFMDASLDNIADLVGLVDQWNNKIPAPARRGGGSAGGRGSPASKGSTRRSGGEKFCTECGAKIPASAKFCSECGAKQEETFPAA
ncbi:haloacid dehalogenase-like hydrolase [Ectocarpus siliculosus]|uniref:Haloacid dehalogenase-like hydrolase n=1 Tax=Ectocarpus siliculosus TaxID=2880 RepID=D8LL24_ECTSI|nr:haloacid dehalogenase-like hydrolase [Ectocarpus siliculosus]|eukprot:CBN76118.1 haloacid dehalogenase-like hydrolase [Ectocarpus siliculosus]